MLRSIHRATQLADFALSHFIFLGTALAVAVLILHSQHSRRC